MLPMARIHGAIFATAVVLLVGGQCSNSNAAPITMTEAEVFWRNFLPDSPLPDAILELLHPETSSYVNEDDESDAQGLHEDYPFFYFRYGERDDKHSSLIRRRSHDDSTATHHLAHGLSSFFHEEALRAGKNMTLYFPPVASAPLGLLPRPVADSIPFSTSSLPSALAQLGIAMDSAQAANMEQTLHKCESPILTGETKFCATSLEAMVEGAMAVLGTRNIWPVTSSLPRSGAPRQPYTIRGVHQVHGSSFVSCHDTYYAYTVYMCHGGTGSTAATRTYMVDMEGINNSGMAITVAAVCHTDTSQWDPEHISFKLLDTKPGGAPICHFMPYGHMIWVKQANRSSF